MLILATMNSTPPLIPADIRRITEKVIGQKRQIVYAKAQDQTDAMVREAMGLSRPQFDRRRDSLFSITQSDSMNGVIWKCTRAGII